MLKVYGEFWWVCRVLEIKRKVSYIKKQSKSRRKGIKVLYVVVSLISFCVYGHTIAFKHLLNKFHIKFNICNTLLKSLVL